MRCRSPMLAFIALALSAPALAADPAPDPVAQQVDQAGQLILAHQPLQALALLDAALASLDRPLADASAKGRAYCATNATESLTYLMLATTGKESATVLGAPLCEGLFLRAYALTELKREPEAVATLEKLTTLAPMHAHYLVELGFAYRVTGAPEKAMSAYRAALDAATGPARGNDGKADHAAALRGIGYLLIDRNDLDGASDAYRKSLADDPTSAIAKSELDYIEGLRRKSR